jgi:hypothetical protein
VAPTFRIHYTYEKFGIDGELALIQAIRRHPFAQVLCAAPILPYTQLYSKVA